MSHSVTHSVRSSPARSSRAGAGLCAFIVIITGAAACRKQEAGAPSGDNAAAARAQRLVTVGSAVTEIVYALGAGAQVLGLDTSSTFPPETAKVPKVGYHRNFAAEGVLALQPTLVLLAPGAGPPTAIDQLRGAGLRVHEVGEGHTLEVARARIHDLAKLLGRTSEGDALVARLDADVARARALTAGRAADPKQRPPVLFLFSHGAGTISASGRGTSADTIIELAGGRNCLDGFKGFRPVTPEAALAAAPELIAIPKRGLDTVGGRAALLAVPGIAATPAAKAGRIVILGDVPLGDVSLRMGEVAVALATALAQLPAGPAAGLAREHEAR
jgi:iron complex transport system substrate-binding protein